MPADLFSAPKAPCHFPLMYFPYLNLLNRAMDQCSLISWLNGKDLRKWPLIKRKEKLKKIIPELPSRILYTPHLDGQGIRLFHEVCKIDLEGIVAKKKDEPYHAGQRHAAWVKIKNPQYSQSRGRHKLFSAMR